MQFDPIAATLAGDADGTIVYAATSKWQVSLIEAMKFLEGNLGLPDYVAQEVVLDALADQISDATQLDLQAPTMWIAVINAAADRFAASLHPSVVANAADVIAASNRQIDQIPLTASQSFLDAMAAEQRHDESMIAETLHKPAPVGSPAARGQR